MLETRYIEIANIIEKDIVNKKHSDKLPGVVKLGSIYGVDPKTISKAITLLVEKDLLFVVPKKGTFVRDSSVTLKKVYIYSNLDISNSPNNNANYQALIYFGISEKLASLKISSEVIQHSHLLPDFHKKLLRLSSSIDIQTEALIIMSSFDIFKDFVPILAQRKVRTVFIQNHFYPQFQFKRVYGDDIDSLERAVLVAVKRGYDCFAHFIFTHKGFGNSNGERRLEGFQRGIEKNRDKVKEVLFGTDIEQFADDFASKIQSDKTKKWVFISSAGNITFNVYMKLLAKGLLVGKDYGFIGFEFSLVSNFLGANSFTGIDYRPAELGKAAADILFSSDLVHKVKYDFQEGTTLPPLSV